MRVTDRFPVGICQCGCGGHTSLRVISRGHGIKAGEPLKFLPMHWKRNVNKKQKFLERIQKTDSCWLWTRPLMSTGYGTMAICGKNILAHRVSWEIYHGPIPPGKYVLHKCDVRACANPDHLFLGDHADNMADMMKKRRHHHGDQHYNAKLSNEKAREIRNLFAAGTKDRIIAETYGVSISTIHDIRWGRSWKYA